MKKLFVGNLPYQSAEGELSEWFNQAGVAVGAIHFIRDRETGQPRGFGFVEVGGDQEAERAIALCNGKPFQGRSLVVSEARPQPGRERASSGRGSAGRGFEAEARGARRPW